MGWLDALRVKQEKKAESSRKQYVSLLLKALQAGNELSKADQAQVEALAAELGLSLAQVEQDLADMRKHTQALAEIADGQKAAREIEAIGAEEKALDEEFTRFRQQIQDKAREIEKRKAPAMQRYTVGLAAEGVRGGLVEARPELFQVTE